MTLRPGLGSRNGRVGRRHIHVHRPCLGSVDFTEFLNSAYVKTLVSDSGRGTQMDKNSSLA